MQVYDCIHIGTYSDEYIVPTSGGHFMPQEKSG